MTHHTEFRFRCDRCGTEAVTPVSNTPTTTRYNGPEGWVAFQLYNEANLMSHLCPKCSAMFEKFMQRKG